MGFADYYFIRYKTEEKNIPEDPAANLGLIVTIPCFNEHNTIMKALESLCFCMPTEKDTEVIVLVNYPESKRVSLKSNHEELYTSLLLWSKAHSKPKLKFHIIFKELPSKTAGAGHARKLAMDEALRRFNSIDNKNGIIASFDADCICDSNYLSELEKLFYNKTETKGCSVYFEHPVEGSEYPNQNYKAIAQYELYLRYYIEALRITGFPHSFHTIGSAFAVRADVYAQQGGMNKRQAGEDFYFLHKIISLGDFKELNSTRIIASPRESDRVIFGTGTAVSKLIQESNKEYCTYNPILFSNLSQLFSNIDILYLKYPEVSDILSSLDRTLIDFLESNEFGEKIKEVHANVSSLETFKKRFFTWFNGLMVFQYLNKYQELYGNLPVTIAALSLLEKKSITPNEQDTISVLKIFREFQRNSNQFN